MLPNLRRGRNTLSPSPRETRRRARVDASDARALAERRDTLVAALQEHIPEARFVVPGGGYFLWLTLEDDAATPELLVAARAEGVAFVAGPDFMLDGGEASLRLSFASVPSDRIDEGVARLAAALDHIRQSAAAA